MISPPCVSPRPAILNVQSSGRRAGSSTRRLSSALIDALVAAGANPAIVERDVADGVAFVDEAWIDANFTPPDARTETQRAALAGSDRLVAEVEAADLIVIGAPIYNFGPPAALKAWIDQIARARKTFVYGPDGPKGLLVGKTAVIVTASGGTPVGGAADFATGYLREALGFLGIRDVHLVAADRQIQNGPGAEDRARREIQAVIEALSSREALTQPRPAVTPT